MAETYRVADLTEALSLVRQFKISGQYDLFRGQAQNWKVVPTVGRLSKESFELAVKKIERLYYFFENNPSLERFAHNIDWFYAVAQHYGLPTNYIDFTTNPEVAAFFATNSKYNKVGEDCAIICLNEGDFASFLAFSKSIYIKDKVIPPYILKINVDNLWRLQAQEGCFLYSPYANIEFYYDFDKIIFPFTIPFTELTTNDIYPKRKSELEILLDQYFNSEKRIEDSKRFEIFAKEINVPITKLSPPQYDQIIKQKKIHSSWKSKEHNKWVYTIKEEWKKPDEVKNIRLHFNIKKSISSQVQSMISELYTFFQSNKVGRDSNLAFEIISTPKLSKRLSNIISRSCLRIWDGTRNLPYTDLEIFAIISKYICLEIFKNKYDEVPSLSEEEIITLEMTNGLGSITRCYASSSKVTSSFRTDIKDILIDALTENINSEILLHINLPTLLFDFNKLLELFKEEVVSYQVLYNSENEEPVIFYTPTQIKVLGYA